MLVCFGALVSATSAHAATFTIGGSVSGLTTGKSVTLLDNGGDSLTVSVNGKFTFKTALATGATYNVTVGTEPTGETCTVTLGSGTVGTKNVTTVKVTCVANKYTIGGTVSGLNSGTSVTLSDNVTDLLTVTANGTFTFAKTVASGAAYRRDLHSDRRIGQGRLGECHFGCGHVQRQGIHDRWHGIGIDDRQISDPARQRRRLAHGDGEREVYFQNSVTNGRDLQCDRGNAAHR